MPMNPGSDHLPLGSTDAPVLALRPRDAARALGVSARTLWTWTRAGKVPHLRIGRVVAYPVAALARWLEDRAKSDGGEG